jgi:Tol biopolymer transport system component
LTRELERIAHPADPTGVLERLDLRRQTRRRRHELLRPVKVGAIASIAVAGTVASFLALSGLFRDGPPAGPTGPGGTIVFGRFQLRLDPDGGSSASRFEIWSMAPDGSDLRLVYAPEAGAMTPTWSPDGERIAFLEQGPPGGWTRELRLITSRPDGSDRQVVAEGLAAPVVPVVAWSPDASRIAVLDTQEKGLAALDDFGLPVTDIAIYSIDGAFERFVDVPGIAAGFAWTPDGSGFFVADISNPRADLLHVDADGRVLGTIAADVSYRASPTFSPDGSRIAFIRTTPSAADPEEGEVWVANADGTGAVRITREGGRKPSLAWSVGGTNILYSRQTPERCDIVSVGADGSDRIVVADRSTMGGCARELSVQPGVPDASATPQTDVVDEAGRDVGMGFFVCQVSEIDAQLNGEGAADTAVVATRLDVDGRCPSLVDEAEAYLGVDLDRDGSVDTTYGPISCEGHYCRVYAAPDLNGDGDTHELLIVESAGSELGLGVYALDAIGSPAGDTAAIVRIKIGESGYRERGFVTGEPARLFIGGNEVWSYSVRCEDHGVNRFLYASRAYHAIDEAGPWTVEETTLYYSHLSLNVFDAREPELSTSDDPLGPQPVDLCGAPIPKV